MIDAGQKYSDGSWHKGSPLFKWYFIHGYPLMIMLGVIASVLTVAYFWKRQKYSWEILQILVIVVIPTSIFGAKFYTMIVNSIRDAGDAEAVKNIWSNWSNLAGLSIYGGVGFAAAAGLVYMRFVRHAVDIRTVVGIVIPTILIGQVLGRWGNFFNHEVYGDVVSESSLNWLPSFIKNNMYIDHEWRAPIFLYESFWSFVGYFLIVWVLNRKAWIKPGTAAGLYCIWYGVERLILQLYRDPTQTDFFDAVTKKVPVNLVTSVLAIMLGLFLFVWWEILSRPRYKWFEKMKSWNGKVKISKIRLIPDTIIYFLTKIFKNIKWDGTVKFKEREVVLAPKKLGPYIYNLAKKDKVQNTLSKFKKDYELIKPIKPRRIMFFGEKVDYKRKYLMYFGPKVENIAKLYIKKDIAEKWSKRELNRGKKNKK